MNKIDTNKWKRFELSSLGFKVIHGKRMKQADRVDGDIPLLTAGKENQGIGAYIGNPLITCNNAITVDMFGNSFYHSGTYAGDDNIYFFINDDISELTKLFMSSIINAENTRLYDFKHQFRQPEADALSVELPVTYDGTPDWKFMENYMQKEINKSKLNLDNLKTTVRYQMKIDVQKWKEFKLTDLNFEVTHGKRMKQADRIDGDIPLLTAGKENQGVGSYISNPLITCKNSITVDMFGNSFYHSGVYAGDDNIYFFTNDNVSKEAKIFIATVINAANGQLYDFKHQFREQNADNLTIPLPVTTDGEPDWKFMEAYMTSVLSKCKEKLSCLKKV